MVFALTAVFWRLKWYVLKIRSINEYLFIFFCKNNVNVTYCVYYDWSPDRLPKVLWNRNIHENLRFSPHIQMPGLHLRDHPYLSDNKNEKNPNFGHVWKYPQLFWCTLGASPLIGLSIPLPNSNMDLFYFFRFRSQSIPIDHLWIFEFWCLRYRCI